MARVARAQCELDIYHVVNRGSGLQIIFESDDDRAFFIKRAHACIQEAGGEIFAWCLMDNHFHLVCRLQIDKLSSALHDIQSGYAGYFNRVHGRSGTLFGSRFKSEPIRSEEHLLAAVRYVHMNPVKAGICKRASDYFWSSYSEHLGPRHYSDTALVLDLLGGTEEFESFHVQGTDDKFIDVEHPRPAFVTDEEARVIAKGILGGQAAGSMKSMDRAMRDAALVKLKEQGLGVRQIQRITGVSLGTISNAGK